MGAAAFLEARSIAVAPGEEAATTIRVRNTGNVVDQFTLSVLGDAQAWSSVEPPTLSLFPGAEETARIVFRPPRSAEVPAGEMPFGVRVDSREDPMGDVVEEGALDIGAFSDTYAELAPRTSRGSRSATHDLAVDNRGNIRLNAQITANDPDKALQFDINPPGVVADPGTAAIAKVAVKPRQKFWRGPPKTHAFHVEVLSPGAPAVGVDGTMLQEAILPPNAVRLAIMALVLAVAAVLAWYFLLQPTILATARQELIAAGATTDASGLPVFPGGTRRDGNDGGGATPTPTSTGNVTNGTPTPTATGGTTETGSPTTATGSPGVTPTPTTPTSVPMSRSGRLTAAGSGETAPPGVTLYITDLFFSNPEGQTGLFTVYRRAPGVAPEDGEVLYPLKLENFRDLDFHWVTPLTIPPEYTLYVLCSADCSAAGVSWSGYQR